MSVPVLDIFLTTLTQPIRTSRRLCHTSVWTISTVDASGNPSGHCNNFESAVAFLLQTEPGKKKRGGKRPAAQISATTADDKGKEKKKVAFKPIYGKTGVELCYHKLREWRKLIKEQQKEVQEHRRANGNYQGAWTEKGPGKESRNVSSTVIDKAMVGAMIANHESKKRQEMEKEESMILGMMEDLKGVINYQIAAIISAGVTGKKPLQRSGASANIAGIELEAVAGDDDAVERCASNLMKHFGAMGSKAGRRKYG